MAIASFVSSTAFSIQNPSLFIQSRNPKPNHFLLLAIPSPQKSLALHRHRRPPQSLGLRCSSGFVSSTAFSIQNPSLFIQSRNPKPNHFLLLAIPSPHKSLALHRHRHRRPPQSLGLRCSSVTPPPLPPLNLLSDSTRSVFSLVSLALSAVRRLFAVAAVAAVPTPSELAEIQSLRGCLSCAIGPLFFAALRDRPSGYLNTPLTVVASGMGKWLDIYSGVLMVRVLLSWFPNIPWDRQPLSAIRDLCDPYLNLFRNIIPPIFDTLDVSPLLAFAVLGTLGSILKSARGMY